MGAMVGSSCWDGVAIRQVLAQQPSRLPLPFARTWAPSAYKQKLGSLLGADIRPTPDLKLVG